MSKSSTNGIQNGHFHIKETYDMLSSQAATVFVQLQFSLGAIANVPLAALPAKVDRTLVAILRVTPPELKAAQGTSVRRLAGLAGRG